MSEQKTIYVVTKGDYSDYQIVAVFDDEAVATRFAERFCGNIIWGCYQVAAYPLNPFVEQVQSGLWWYEVSFDDYGEVTVRASGEGDRPSESDLTPRRVTYSYTRPGQSPGCVRVTVEARDRDHAIKIASDRKAEWLAQQAGIS